MKTKKLWMVKEDGESDEHLAFYNLDLMESKRLATTADETLEAMADMMDAAAEDCNAHDFVCAHRGLAAIMYQEIGRADATKIMRRIVNYEGLYGLVGVCGKGDEKTVTKELGIQMHDWASDWALA